MECYMDKRNSVSKCNVFLRARDQEWRNQMKMDKGYPTLLDKMNFKMIF